MYCYACGTQLSDSANFCFACGAPQAIARQKADRFICPVCRREFSREMVFCDACGMRLLPVREHEKPLE